MDFQAVRPVAMGFAVALSGAGLAHALHIPLPWILGPLLLTAAVRIAGAPVACKPLVNQVGRWVIGMSLGLYFTPQVAASLAQHWLVIMLGVAYAMTLAFIGMWVYRRWAGLDERTAWFAAAIGSASEMANLAAQFGARVDHVATVHSVRVMLVTVTVPFAFHWFAGPVGEDVQAAGALVSADLRGAVQWPGLLWLVLGGWASGWLMERLRMPNGWMLGPLFFAMALTLMEWNLSALPAWVSAMGQLFIGWSLGDKYRRDFFRTAPRLLATASVLTLLMIGFSAWLGWLLAQWLGLQTEALVLGLTPGGIAEMTITAKVLGLGVPLVTAMQVARMLCVVVATGPIYQYALRPRERQMP